MTQNSITVHHQQDFNQQLVEMDKIQETCKKLLATKHYQRLGEEGIHAIMAKCKALGIHPFEGLNSGFYVVQGKVGMSTEMMAALVRQRGHSIRKDSKSNNECVILYGKRADTGDEWTCTFTKEDAIAAGLWGTATWKKYPQVMLYNRCMSMLFRQLFPDLSLGAGYVEDELKEITKTGDYQLAECEIADTPKAVLESYVQEEKKALIPAISSEQSNALLDVLAKCSAEYKKEVNDFLTEKKKTVFNLPIPLFEKIMNKSVNAMNEYQNAKKELDLQTGEIHD